jgi:predicted transcriptional regulator
MLKEYADLTDRILKLLEKDPGQPVQELAKELKINRTFLAGYLKALENQGYVKSKRIGPAKVYFNVKNKEEV